MKLAKDKSHLTGVPLPKRKPKSNCPIHYGLEIFGDAWSLLVVRDLMFKGKTSYRELVESDESISTNILADRLVQLEEHGIITKEVIHTAAARTSYRLTEKGLDLMPMLLELIVWSAKYDRRTAAPSDFVRRVRRDRDGLIKELKANY